MCNTGLEVLEPRNLTLTPAPLECYIMQGEQPLPDAVIQKFAKTGGELCKNVFMLSTFLQGADFDNA